MPKYSLSNKKGFTLIELMLVVVIISILSGVILSVLNVSGLRAKSRDSQRKTDLARIKSALELYYTDNRRYPSSTSNTWENIQDSGSSLKTNLEVSFIDVLPSDTLYDSATAPDDACSVPTSYRYNYISPSDGSFYMLSAVMEVSTSDDDSKCSNLGNWSKDTCGAGADDCSCTGGTITADTCYGLQNPF